MRQETDTNGWSRPRVVVADHSYLIREFLCSTLRAAPEVELVAVCSNGKELETAVAASRPDVVLTDIPLAPLGTDEGIRVATRLRETSPQTGVVVLTHHTEPRYALALLDRGTTGRAYLVKERVRNREELIEAIQAVARGGSVIDPLIVDLLLQARARARRSALSELTPREYEVLAEIAAGKSNGAIAEALYLTKRAVEKHVNSIFSKLGLRERDDVSRRVKATLVFLAEAPGTISP
jgi:DNA-binding NarL/FixJ family response regulator